MYRDHIYTELVQRRSITTYLQHLKYYLKHEQECFIRL